MPSRLLGGTLRIAASMNNYSAKRKVERIPVAAPIDARVGNVPTVVRDVSVLGCRLEHDAPLKVRQPAQLQFSWNGARVVIDCEVVRCTLTPNDQRESGAAAYTSGVRFLEATSESVQTLRKMIAQQVEQAFEEQIANAHADVPEYLREVAILPPNTDISDPYSVRRRYESSTLLPWLRQARNRGFVRWELDGERWKRVRTHDPEQPVEGFTLWAWESEEQVDLLKRAYSSSDATFRSLIRICAELSLIVDDTLPPQKFQPHV